MHKTFMPSTSRLTMSTSASDVLVGKDETQAQLMSEEIILVSPADAVIGKMSKKDSHLVSNNLPLHRAFSLFLFDSAGRMLLQRRAAEKVTFPSYWTNTVCSHPLHNAAELGEEDGDDSVVGAKRAAIRKLGHELGVKEGSLGIADLTFMTRVHYRAENGDGVWGEHEVDYVFVAQRDVELRPEPNEVSDVRYVDQKELKELFAEADKSEGTLLTPWFQHIVNGFGWPWWDRLLEKGPPGLEGLRDPHMVHHMGDCGVHCSRPHGT